MRQRLRTYITVLKLRWELSWRNPAGGLFRVKVIKIQSDYFPPFWAFVNVIHDGERLEVCPLGAIALMTPEEAVALAARQTLEVLNQ
jgi:hypothetical protein